MSVGREHGVLRGYRAGIIYVSTSRREFTAASVPFSGKGSSLLLTRPACSLGSNYSVVVSRLSKQNGEQKRVIIGRRKVGD